MGARMKERFVVVMGLLVGLVVVACGNSDADDDSSAGKGGGSAATSGMVGQSGMTGASGGGSTGLGGMGPVITSAPPAWSRPAECGAIGDLCPEGIFGCGSLSTCQLEGYVCIPALEPGATALPGPTAEHPYCAAFTCMTFEQASCFCTGEAAELYSGCSSPSALAGLCAAEDAACDSKACCDGLTCVDTGSGKRCKTTCSTSAGCESGCCTDLYDNGTQVCADLTACTNPCKKRGETCSQGGLDAPANCCRGTCVDSPEADFSGCRPACATSADCDTGCCIPFSNTTSGFCVDAKYCMCASVGGSCAESPCCEGSLCGGATLEEATCFQECTTTADCPTGVCTPFSDDAATICWDGGSTTCIPAGGSCATSPCCDGAACDTDSTGAPVCYPTCTTTADCTTGTCQPLSDASGSICREGGTCGVLDALCDDIAKCCATLVCAGYTEGDFSCYRSCLTDLDCPTGYCTDLDAGLKICLDDTPMICATEGLRCDPGVADCCEGLCVTDASSGMGRCGNSCTQGSECATNCCPDLAAPEGKFCSPEANCP